MDLELVFEAVDLVSGVISSVISSIKSLGDMVMSVGGSITHDLLEPLALIGGIGGVAGFAEIIGKSIDATSRMDALNAAMLAFNQNQDIAAQKTAWLKEFGRHAVASEQDIIAAGVELEAFGINSSHFIKNISAAGAAFQELRPAKQTMLELVQAMGRLKAGAQTGMTGEVFRLLRRFGITQLDFLEHGIPSAAHAGGVRLLGTWQQILTAFDQILGEKFGKVGDLLADKLPTALSNLQASFFFAFNSIGDVLETIAMPALRKFTNFINYITDSKILTVISTQLTHLFNMDVAGSLLIKGVALFLAVLEHIPDMVQLVGNAFSVAFKYIADHIKFVIDLLLALGGGQVLNIISGLLTIFHAIAFVVITISSHIRAFIGLLSTAFGWFLHWNNALSGYDASIANIKKQLGDFGKVISDHFKGSAVSNIIGGIHTSYQDILKGFASGAGKENNVPQYPGLGKDENYQQQIADNTRRTAENTRLQLDLRKYALGGGDLGRMGITPMELAHGRAVASRINLNIQGKTFEDLINEVVGQAILAHQGVH